MANVSFSYGTKAKIDETPISNGALYICTDNNTLYADYGNTFITNRDGLLDRVRFLIMSKEAKENIEISGHINGALIEQNFDSSISDISLIKSITSTDNVENLDVRFAMSKDSGKTWQTYDAGG